MIQSLVCPSLIPVLFWLLLSVTTSKSEAPWWACPPTSPPTPSHLQVLWLLRAHGAPLLFLTPPTISSHGRLCNTALPRHPCLLPHPNTTYFSHDLFSLSQPVYMFPPSMWKALWASWDISEVVVTKTELRVTLFCQTVSTLALLS